MPTILTFSRAGGPDPLDPLATGLHCPRKVVSNKRDTARDGCLFIYAYRGSVPACSVNNALA